MSTFVIDTHAFVWYLDGDKRLSKSAERELDSSGAVLVFPTVVLAEVKYLFARKRIRTSFSSVMETIETDDRCIIYPFDLLCVELLDERLDLHDGVIAATGVILRDRIDPSPKVITKDTKIRELGIIETLW